jgi:hypothetical protein
VNGLDKIDIKDLIEIEKKQMFTLTSMLSKSMHGLNNALTVFSGQASIIKLLMERNKLTSEKIEEVTARLNTSIKDFQTNINKIRSFYYFINSANTELKISNALDTIENLFSNDAFNKGIKLDIKISQDWSVEFNGHNLYKILENSIQMHFLFADNHSQIKMDSQILDTKKLIVISSNIKADSENHLFKAFKTINEEICLGLKIGYNISNEDQLKIVISID